MGFDRRRDEHYRVQANDVQCRLAKPKPSQAEYEKRLQVTDERYAEMLTALIAELKTGLERRIGISSSQPPTQRRMSGHDMELVIAGVGPAGR